MSVLAVPCDQVVVLTKEQGEKMLMEINSRKITEEERTIISKQAKALRRKPVKND